MHPALLALLLPACTTAPPAPSAPLPNQGDPPSSAVPDDARPPHGHGNLNEWDTLLRKACGVSENGALMRGAKREDLPFSSTFGRSIEVDPNAKQPTLEQLAVLAKAMDESDATGALNAPDVPAGLIFLGQFIDHDVTLDVVSQLSSASDPAEIETLRTPRLDLDSVYGDGPEASAHLYDTNRHGFLLVGTKKNALDLPRNIQGTALIGDPRNDENAVIAQMHGLFLRFHNAVLADVENGAFDRHRWPDEDDFDFARRIVRWHYQWIVAGEFLPAVVNERVLAAVEVAILDQTSWCGDPELPSFPIEFSAAAYRFGHSQIRGHLQLRRGAPALPLLARDGDLRGFAPIDPTHNIDWDLFFDVGYGFPQAARTLDIFLAPELLDLPFASNEPGPLTGHPEINNANLAFRNLQRGSLTFQLPTGEWAHGKLYPSSQEFPNPVDPHESVKGLGGTPLWFYCLHEAGKFDGKLGPVGGTIVATTLLRMLTHDPLSYRPDRDTHEVARFLEAAAEISPDVEAKIANAPRSSKSVTDGTAKKTAAWKPFLGRSRTFTMADLVRYVQASEGR